MTQSGAQFKFKYAYTWRTFFSLGFEGDTTQSGAQFKFKDAYRWRTFFSLVTDPWQNLRQNHGKILILSMVNSLSPKHILYKNYCTTPV